MYAKTGILETFIAGGEIAENRIVKHGSGDRVAVVASAGNDKLMGVSCLPLGTSTATGEPFDVARSGVANIEYGGEVERGDLLTSDADGRAVVAEDGDRVIGIAQTSGVAGDFGGVLIQISDK